MELQPYEVAVLLKEGTGLTYSELASRLGYSEPRALRRCLAAPGGGKMKSVYSETLQIILYELLEMPWGDEWRYPLGNLHALREKRFVSQIEREYGAQAKLITCIANDAPRRDRVGAYFFAAQYHMTFALHPRSQDNRATHIEKALSYFELVRSELDDDNPLESVFATKCVGNIVAIHWNTKPRDQRDSPQMRQLLNEIDFFGRIDAYIDRFPKFDTAPFAALAVASVLNMQERFEPLYRALTAANPNFEAYAEFDEDFSNFESWVAQQNNRAA